MSRIETIGECTLYLGDCRDILPTLGPVDAVVTDPPYGIGESAKRNNTRSGPGGRLGGLKPRDYGQDDWDQEPCPPEIIAWMRANSRWQIIFGGNHLHELVVGLDGCPVRVGLPPAPCWLVWDKENTGDFADAELAWTNLPKAVRLKRHMWNGGLRKGGEERVHLTQKPLDVMAWSLSHLPADARLICDPFMGSGTTGVACARDDLSFIGVERESRYFDIACRRIEEAYKQPRLFAEPVVKPVQSSIFDGEAA